MVAPIALTTFVLVVFLNAMDFLPVDIVAGGLHAPRASSSFRLRAHRRREHHVRARAVGVRDDDLLLDQGEGTGRLAARAGRGSFAEPLESPCCHLQPAVQRVEYISKPLSHSLRLFGNMYAARSSSCLIAHARRSAARSVDAGRVLVNLGWAIFHILIVSRCRRTSS
jgi:F-type H+-transporting ATPase subunit a